MNLETFESRARRMWDEIPTTARAGVDRLAIEAASLSHPDFDWVYTMGECATENWPSGFGGEGDTRSELVLYYGSYQALAEEDAAFDWEGELWETILHELLHHREAAAGESGLDEFDWAEEQNFRRLAGDPFDPAFYRAVPAGSDGVIRLDSEMFVETLTDPRAPEAIFTWRETAYSVRVPAEASQAFVGVRNLAGGRLCVVVKRQRRWWRFGADRGDVFDVMRSALPLPAAA